MSLRPVHRAGRFFASLWPFGPARNDLDWVRGELDAPMWAVFTRMARVDQRHSIGVARRAIPALDALGLDEDRRRAAVAAALLHDIGKATAGLGTYGRVVATLSERFGGLDMADAWQESSGFTRRVGLYLNYPRIGADLLELHGADPWVVAWAREHHLPTDLWTVPEEVGRVLQRCDR